MRMLENSPPILRSHCIFEC